MARMNGVNLPKAASRAWAYLILGAIVWIAYLPTLSGGFILDDNPLIKNNVFLKEKQPLYSYFAQEDGVLDYENESDSYHTGYYRPLTALSFRLDHILWGANSTGFRTTNLVLHVLTCCLLFRCVCLFAQNRQTALWVVLVFAVHPANTETVAWASARNNILTTLFVLSSFFCYVRGWEKQKHGYLALAVVSFALAVASKEFGLLALPLFFLYHRFLKDGNNHISHEILSYLPFILITIGYFVLRKTVIGTWLSPAVETNLWERIYFTPYLIAVNSFITLFPHNLHNFIVGYPASQMNWKALGALIFTIGSFFALWKLKRNRLALFGIVSFLLGLSPVLNIIPTSAVSLISMRWLYFPIAFLTFGAVSLVAFVIKQYRFATIGVLCAIIAYFGAYSHILNQHLWHNEDSFLRQEVLHYQNYFYAGGLAENLFNKHQYDQAEKYFEIAMKYYPNDARDGINYSALLIDTGRPESAVTLLQRKKSLPMTRKEKAEWHNNMGMAYFQMKDYNQALVHLQRATVIEPDKPTFWANLGAAYGQMGEYRTAVFVLERGIRKAGRSSQLERNLKVAYHHLKSNPPNLSSVSVHSNVVKIEDAADARR